LGREEEAFDEAAEVLRVSPGFSLEKVPHQVSGGNNWQDPGIQRYLSILRKAGVK